LINETSVLATIIGSLLAILSWVIKSAAVRIEGAVRGNTLAVRELIERQSKLVNKIEIDQVMEGARLDAIARNVDKLVAIQEGGGMCRLQPGAAQDIARAARKILEEGKG